jgi:putative DNA primase/helicase
MSTNPTTSSPQPETVLADQSIISATKKPVGSVRATPQISEMSTVGQEPFASFPAELKCQRIWCMWRLEADRNGKLTKVPYRDLVYKASSTKSDTWTCYETALSNFLNYQEEIDGIGCFAAGEISFIDFDDCRDVDNGEIEPWAEKIIAELDTYTEVSPSGTGLHAFVRGIVESASKINGCEIYSIGRFFTVTGKHVSGTPLEVNAYPRLTEFRRRIAGNELRPYKLQKYGAKPCSKTGLGLVLPKPVDLGSLLAGDLSRYDGDQSRADLAACNLLLRKHDGDVEKAETEFRESALMRPKWDEMRGAKTYGDLTLGKAVKSYEEWKAWEDREKDLTQFRYTDSGNAERLVAKYGEDFRYLHDSKRWLHWDRTRWNPDQTAEIHRAAKETVHIMHQDATCIKDDTVRQKFAVWVARSESRGTRENMVALAQNERKVSALSSQFDTRSMLLNVLNGTLDLETFELGEHRREDLLTKLCPVSFDPGAECPRWLSFLQEIFPGQPEVIEFLQRSVGYSLTGDTEEQCFWLLIGVGKNGKSKFMDAVQFLLGDYAVATSFDTFAAKKDSAAINPRDGMASLAGSRFVRASESDEGRRFSEAQIKALTGGERIRTARMYQEDFDFKPTFKIWLSTNNEPQIHGTDEGIWRRINRVNFGVVIPEEKRDRQLGAKLQAEVSGILNWALMGLKQYRMTGLKVPDMVIQATAQYREGQNLVGRFLDEKTEKVSDTFTFSATELYTSFKNWARDNGEAVLTRTKFGKEAKKLLSDKRDGTGRVVYVGIRLRQEERLEELDAAAIPF